MARALGISQPSVSNWKRVPSERVVAVEAATGVPREVLRPDLYPGADGDVTATALDPIDEMRAHEYGLLALLLGRVPTEDVLAKLATLSGDATPLGMAHVALARAAAATTTKELSRAYFRLFIGVGRGELLPYASWYMTGFLQERPLARVREDLGKLGIARGDHLMEPEDHVAILCDVMSALVARRFATPQDADRAFFERHLQPWAERFFSDLETASDEPFYRAVGGIGRLFTAIEAEAFALAA